MNGGARAATPVEVARSIVAEVTGIPASANLTRLVLAAGGAQRTTKEP